MIGTDPRTDLALIKIEGRAIFPFVRLADTPPRVGDWVLAVGNPFGLGGSVTAGIVSARGRDIGAGPYDDFLQIDAPVNRGNSGGPTFNVEGQVIGVNTAIFSPSGGNVGIAFAIPAETVNNVVAQLQARRAPSPADGSACRSSRSRKEIADSLGLKNAEGALVAEPQANSPATKAGIEAGDVIVSVDGNAIKDARELSRRIGSMSPGETVRLGVLRSGKERTVSLTLGELPPDSVRRAPTFGRRRGGDRDRGEPRLGLSLAPGGSEPGVVVAEVDPRGPAAEIGFRAGDVILDVAGRQVHNPADVRQRARRRPQGRQAQHPDAHQVGARHALRGDPAGACVTRAPAIRSGRSVGIRRPRRRCEPGDGSCARPRTYRLVFRHSSPPPGTGSVEGRWSNPPPLAFSPDRSRFRFRIRYHGGLTIGTPMRLLIVEDDRDAADYIARAFREVGHVADQAPDGEEGLALATDRSYDVLIVDRMLPKRDGLSVIGELRAKGVETPVLILSALGQVDDRVKGLRAGGDDYLPKPYSFSELLARVEVLARRRGGREETVYRVGDLELDRLSHRVMRNGEEIVLQPREFRLLEYLMRHAGQVVTRTMLLENVWDYHFDPQTNVIDVHISRLRSKIDKGFGQPLLHTIRGAGYMVRA